VRLARLCDALVSLGLLRRLGGRYRSTADAARFLDARSPHALVDAVRFFDRPPVTAAFARLSQTVRRGRGGGSAASSSRLWRTFAGTTVALRRQLAVDIAAELGSRGLIGGRMLDIGAGASPLGIELLARAPAAILVVQDRPAVVKLAMGHAKAAGVARRVTAISGDAARAAWGGPYDLIVMVNVLDYFEAETRARLLRKARTALKPGGALAVYAPLLDRGRTSPPAAVAYDLLLLALNAKGCASTYGELRLRLRRAGFASITRCRNLPLVLARRR
jgi:2-polyprenyl-3-methyl-5-hydroxy-6-metoxy-1,4-benzoquinol methylase